MHLPPFLFGVTFGLLLLIWNLAWIFSPFFYAACFIGGWIFFVVLSAFLPKVVLRKQVILEEESRHLRKHIESTKANWYCVEGRGIRIVKSFWSTPDIYVGLSIAARMKPEQLQAVIKDLEQKAVCFDRVAISVCELLDDWCGVTRVATTRQLEIQAREALWVFLHLPLAFVLNAYLEKKL
jgi:hypothetical protein